MKVIIKVTLAIIAITMALTLFLTANDSGPSPTSPSPPSKEPASTGRVSRFLQQKGRNPNAADHCNKDNDICHYLLENGQNATTCCNNKCVDLQEDDNNCGACKEKCGFLEACCRGECVLLAFDKRHCGECDYKCMDNGFCIYGMCDYA